MSSFFAEKKDILVYLGDSWDEYPEVDAYVMSVDNLSYLYQEEGQNHKVPVIAYGREDKLRDAFVFGAEDYLREPWSFDELGIRLLKLIRFDKLSLGSVHWRIVSPFLHGNTSSEELNVKEEKILRLLIQNQGSTVSRSFLRIRVWPEGDLSEKSRTLDMHVSNLRKKLILTSLPLLQGHEIIRTRKPDGYMIPL